MAPDNDQTFQPEPNTLILEDKSLKYGFVQLPKQLLYARNLSRDAKILYAILLGYAWQEDRCFPGYRRLCFDMQASENMVRKYMRELEAVGLLSQKRRGLGKTNIYTLHDLRTSKIEVQEPHGFGTSKTEVLEPQKTEVPEPSKSEVKKETVEQETVVNNPSKVRKGPTRNEQGETGRTVSSGRTPRGRDQTGSYQGTLAPSRSGETVQSRPAEQDPDGLESAPESVSAILHRRQPVKPTDEDRQVILAYLEDFAREFRDSAPLKSSVSRALNLYQQAGCSRDVFIAAMYQARVKTKEATKVRNRMSFWFACLENSLGLKAKPERPSASQ